MLDIALFAAYTASSVIGLLLVKHAMPLARADWQSGFAVSTSGLLLVFGACLYVAAIWLVILARTVRPCAMDCGWPPASWIAAWPAYP